MGTVWARDNVHGVFFILEMGTTDRQVLSCICTILNSSLMKRARESLDMIKRALPVMVCSYSEVNGCSCRACMTASVVAGKSHKRLAR